MANRRQAMNRCPVCEAFGDKSRKYRLWPLPGAHAPPGIVGDDLYMVGRFMYECSRGHRYEGDTETSERVDGETLGETVFTHRYGE